MNTQSLLPLKGSYLFKGISESELAILGPLFSEKKLPEGMTVFLEQMPGEALYLVKKGTIIISKMHTEGDEKTLAVLGPDDAFGEMAILDGAPRLASARVAEEAILLGFRKADFDTLCEGHPRLGLKLMANIVRMFTRRLRQNTEDYKEILLASSGRDL